MRSAIDRAYGFLETLTGPEAESARQDFQKVAAVLAVCRDIGIHPVDAVPPQLLHRLRVELAKEEEQAEPASPDVVTGPPVP